MSAKEMFEKLGYEDTSKEYHNLVRYVKEDAYLNLKREKIICIELNSNEVQIACTYGKYDYGTTHLSLEELQAINKQVEELGWK